jgi:hypothetical protein
MSPSEYLQAVKQFRSTLEKSGLALPSSMKACDDEIQRLELKAGPQAPPPLD